MEISNPKIVEHISGIPFRDMGAILKAVEGIFSKDVKSPELIKALVDNMEVGRDFCGYYNPNGCYNEATNIIIDVRRLENGLYLMALSSKEDKDIESKLAGKIKKDRALRYVELSLDIATCEDRVELDCEEVIGKLKTVDAFIPLDMCAEDLMAGLTAVNGDFGVPFVPILSDGNYTVLFTLEDVPSAVGAVFFGGREGWRREGTALNMPLLCDIEEGGFRQPKMKFYILRYHTGDPSQRPPFLEKEEVLEADHIAQSILSCFFPEDMKAL